MSARVAVPAEVAPGERRVALVPAAVVKLAARGIGVTVEAGAGRNSYFADDDYAQAGATLVVSLVSPSSASPERQTFFAAGSWRRSQPSPLSALRSSTMASRKRGSAISSRAKARSRSVRPLSLATPNSVTT